MGAGIAQVAAAAGNSVAVADPDPGVRASLLPRVRAISEMLELDDRAQQLIEAHEDLQGAVQSADIVIEAGPEVLAVKRQIFADLVRWAPANAVLATNTSAIPVRDITAGLETRDRMLGTHFWNPPYLVPLVEVVESEMSSPAAVVRAMEFLAAINMVPVHVRADIPGFVGNRLQHALKREAIALVANGVCSAEDVDTVVKEGFGARLALMGPLEQSDLVGLELTLQIHETLMPSLDRTAEPHPYLVGLVRAGHVGAAAGKGFRTWQPTEADAARARLNTGLRAAAIRRRRHLSEPAEGNAKD